MLFSDRIQQDIIKAAEPLFNGPAALLFYQAMLVSAPEHGRYEHRPARHLFSVGRRSAGIVD